jgi:DNA-binding response OmpR family regulator
MARILIIEDDEILVEMYEAKFKMEGFEVEKALNGKDGLELLKKDKPDLILLDILMPEMNGFEFLKNIKKEPSYHSVPVILLTNLGDPEIDMDREMAYALGVRDYLIKSRHTPDEVVKRAKDVLAEAK